MKILLFPLAILYDGITRIRNLFYNKSIFKSYSFSRNVISVGNLSMGGTGKTPMIEYLIKLLNRYNIVALSRGYKRSTKGFLLSSELTHVSASVIGDEPMQYFIKFSPKVNIAVGENRAHAIQKIEEKLPSTEIILLDDAFQHRRVVPKLNILLTSFHKPYFRDFVVPSGTLRESRKGANRADMVVVTKCPSKITKSQKEDFKFEIFKYTKPGIPVYFSTIRYGSPTPFYNKSEIIGKNIIAFSGIADNTQFKNYVVENFNLINFKSFPDHHAYTKKDIQEVIDIFSGLELEDISILTTEKDMVKLLDGAMTSLIRGLPVFYIPIEVEFVGDKKDFDQIVLKSIRNYNY